MSLHLADNQKMTFLEVRSAARTTKTWSETPVLWRTEEPKNWIPFTRKTDWPQFEVSAKQQTPSKSSVCLKHGVCVIRFHVEIQPVDCSRVNRLLKASNSCLSPFCLVKWFLMSIGMSTYQQCQQDQTSVINGQLARGLCLMEQTILRAKERVFKAYSYEGTWVVED